MAFYCNLCICCIVALHVIPIGDKTFWRVDNFTQHASRDSPLVRHLICVEAQSLDISGAKIRQWLCMYVHQWRTYVSDDVSSLRWVASSKSQAATLALFDGFSFRRLLAALTAAAAAAAVAGGRVVRTASLDVKVHSPVKPLSRWLFCCLLLVANFINY